MAREVFAVFVAGGSGTRMGGGTPKQFLELGGIPVLQRSVEIFLAAEPSCHVIIVLPETGVGIWSELCLKHAVSFPQTIVHGGLTRFHSVRNALGKVPDGAIVSIHDAVRPLASPALVRGMLDRMQVPGGPEALIPVVPVIDTLRCTIVKAYRHTGTKTSRQERIDAFTYRVAQVFGYRIDTFIRDYRVSYAYRPDSTLYPAEVSYKLVYGGRDGDYDEKKEEFSRQTGGGFPNMEATLKVSPVPSKRSGADCAQDPDEASSLLLEEAVEAFIDLPPSWYIKYNTDADRQKEIELSSLPATFSIYEED